MLSAGTGRAAWLRVETLEPRDQRPVTIVLRPVGRRRVGKGENDLRAGRERDRRFTGGDAVTDENVELQPRRCGASAGAGLGAVAGIEDGARRRSEPGRCPAHR